MDLIIHPLLVGSILINNEKIRTLGKLGKDSKDGYS